MDPELLGTPGAPSTAQRGSMVGGDEADELVLRDPLEDSLFAPRSTSRLAHVLQESRAREAQSDRSRQAVAEEAPAFTSPYSVATSTTSPRGKTSPRRVNKYPVFAACQHAPLPGAALVSAHEQSTTLSTASMLDSDPLLQSDEARAAFDTVVRDLEDLGYSRNEMARLIGCSGYDGARDLVLIAQGRSYACEIGDATRLLREVARRGPRDLAVAQAAPVSRVWSQSTRKAVHLMRKTSARYLTPSEEEPQQLGSDPLIQPRPHLRHSSSGMPQRGRRDVMLLDGAPVKVRHGDPDQARSFCELAERLLPSGGGSFSHGELVQLLGLESSGADHADLVAVAEGRRSDCDVERAIRVLKQVGISNALASDAQLESHAASPSRAVVRTSPPVGSVATVTTPAQLVIEPGSPEPWDDAETQQRHALLKRIRQLRGVSSGGRWSNAQLAHRLGMPYSGGGDPVAFIMRIAEGKSTVCSYALAMRTIDDLIETEHANRVAVSLSRETTGRPEAENATGPREIAATGVSEGDDDDGGDGTQRRDVVEDPAVTVLRQERFGSLVCQLLGHGESPESILIALGIREPRLRQWWRSIGERWRAARAMYWGLATTQHRMVDTHVCAETISEFTSGAVHAVLNCVRADFVGGDVLAQRELALVAAGRHPRCSLRHAVSVLEPIALEYLVEEPSSHLRYHELGTGPS